MTFNDAIWEACLLAIVLYLVQQNLSLTEEEATKIAKQQFQVKRDDVKFLFLNCHKW